MQTLLRRFGLLVAASLLAFIALPAPPTQAAEVLLSQGRPATASSTEGVFSARSAVDGDPGTRWSSAFADPQWIQVDLGVRAEISRVALNWEAAYATSFRIEVSDDARTWTVLHRTATGAGGAQSLTVTGAGRYVRMYGTQRATRGITYSLDGRTVFSLNKDQVEQTRGPWIFDHPHHMILNLAVGGDWPGPTDAGTPFPAKLLVDYVRVFQ
ncbi:discoidin domain-containing protein [Streptomyces sp. NPDC002755]|uniref:discoidin domain-containing protein n=1 Tax=Streptomyces sp. NPDC002884 TaxID=3154544 RepID=UPI00332F9B5C